MSGTAFFSGKVIELQVTLGAGSFDGGTVKIINGLAVETVIEKIGLPDKNRATVTVYGMKHEDMEQLTMLAFRPREARDNRIAILAGEGAKLAQAFAGEITNASADYNAAPDVPFRLEAQSGFYPSLIPEPPISVKGEVPVTDVVARLAKKIGYSFSAKNVTAKLRNPVLNGTPLEKARAAARQAGVTLLVDDGSFILLPEGEARDGAAVRLSKETGLIGYPTFGNQGIALKTYYNPALVHNGLIEVESSIRNACGVWRITKLSHSLSAFRAGGQWQSEITAIPAETRK